MSQKQLDLQTEMGRGQLGLSGRQLEVSQSEFEKQLAATLGYQTGQLGLQQGYLDLARNDSLRSGNQQSSDIGYANAAAFANAGGGWGQVYSGGW